MLVHACMRVAQVSSIEGGQESGGLEKEGVSVSLAELNVPGFQHASQAW